MQTHTLGVAVSRYPIGYLAETDQELREELIARGLLKPREIAVPLRFQFHASLPMLRIDGSGPRASTPLEIEPLNWGVCFTPVPPPRMYFDSYDDVGL
jgi:hypothetical protein